jgi:hypothetical protein
MTFIDIVKKWQEAMKNHPDWRKGQALYNSIDDQELANQIRGVPHLDPYYRDEYIGDCLDFIDKYLYRKVNDGN